VNAADLLALAGIVVLLACSAVLAIAETTFTHLGRGRAAAIDEQTRRKALADDDPLESDPTKGGALSNGEGGNGNGKPEGRLTGLLARREQILPPILLLVLLCHLAIATLVAVLAYERWGATGALVGFLLAAAVIFVAGEAVPKTYALQHTERAATRVAPLVSALALFPPIRWLTRMLIGLSNVILPGKGRVGGPSVTEEELLALAGAAAEDEVIEAEEQALIRSIIEFGDTVAREVMVPRTDMVTVEATFRVVDAMEVAILNGFSRMPATGEGIDDIVGVVYAKDLMRAERDGRGDRPVSELAREANFVPETKRVPDLLREMQAERFHLAVVVDEYGGTAGIATLEDLIEELVGEIRDEYDVEEPMVEPLPGGGVRVNARMAVDDLGELLDMELPEGDWDSVGGLVFTTLGRVPANGEEVTVDGLVLRAERVVGRRIGKVRVTMADAP
jgi:CBS domain containing-hemolysin-like protein